MQITIQIGKNGLTEGLIQNLKNMFKKHDDARVHLLKTATRDKEKAEQIAQQICATLGRKYTYKIVGFTIFIKKWRKIPASIK